MTKEQKASLRRIAAKVRKLADQATVSEYQVRSLADEIVFEIEEDGHDVPVQQQKAG